MLHGLLRRSLARIRRELDAVPEGDTAFSRCQALEVQLGVVERFWQFYRDRLDQRGRPSLRRALAAADEIVWSCYTGLGGTDASAVPLPYAEPTSTPAAMPRTSLPQGARSSDRLLADLLGRLPLPVIAVPAPMLAAPWWLALLAHEVGHHVQYDLEPDQALVGKTADAIARGAGDAADRWTPWRYELFADACSVVAIGATAIDAIAELEWSSIVAMCADRAAYPPTVVRLSVMCAMAEQLGLAAPALGAERWRTAPGAERLAGDLARAREVAAALLELDVAGRRLGARIDREALGLLGAFRDRLAGRPIDVGPGRRAARLAAAAAFDRYHGSPGEGLDELGGRMLDLIEATADGATRAAADLAAKLDAHGVWLDRQLATLPPDGDA